MKNKKLIIFLGSLLFLILFILKGVPLLVNLYLNSHADKIVSDLITRTNDFSGHKVKFGKIHLNYDYRGTYLELDSVAIFPDEIADNNRVKIDLLAERILLSGFLWKSLLLDNAIVLDSAELRKVTIHSMSPSLDSLNLKSKEEIKRKKGKDYTSIQVNHIDLDDFSIENRDIGNDSSRLEIAGLNVTANHFTLTSEDLEDPKALFDVEMIEGKIRHASIHFNEYRNEIITKNLTFSKEKRSLSIDSVRLDNKWDKYKYINDFRLETDWVELERGNLELVNMNYDAYFREGIIEAEKLLAKDIKIAVFRDKRKPDNTQKRPKMIHKIIGGIPKDLHVDMIKMENGYVSYEERPDNEAPVAGQIYFDQIDAEIINITNIPKMLDMHSELNLKANARIMGKGNVDLNVTYFLQDSTGGFTMNGHVKDLDLTAINPMLRPATQVEVRSGVIDDLSFDIKGNDVEGTGDLIMKYHNLAIDIRGKSYGKGQNVFQKIGSFLTNKLVIRSENPNKKGELKTGDIYFKRDQSKFIFNYWWKMILSGMRSTLTGEDEAKMREKAEKKD
ncbi:DUF748 domain-containing protein [Echinicola sp. CAU 1574]|uniref:DUF748 domain-containing protein n=1 Tax=Echinicola arenosa TaxID=2774144 RepID=A0ABR9AQM9_9BACT|nr:DUF748 domain-containing protein [Echinicola arenosa]MBD8491062.1 DUF748 domain-containing protein [Echinicola arenosa]